jgi:Leucine-rich repeat (LRR) protein
LASETSVYCVTDMVLTVVSRTIVDDILAKYGQVSKLNLSDNGIKKVESMEKMTELEKLDLSGNQIANVEGVATLQNLIELNLQHNNM